MGVDAGIRKFVAMVAIGLSLAACAGSSGRHGASEASGQARSRGYFKVGAPYQVNGVWYYPRVDYDYDETGIASWYGEAFNGRPTANGEVFDLNQVSAAHKTLQLPSIAEITNLQNGRTLKIRINDRGPYAGDRIIDLSRRAAQLLGFERTGTAPVRVRIIRDESIKVAEAAMRGNIGQTRVAQAPRPSQTRIVALGPKPGGIRAAAPSGRVEVAAASAMRRTPVPAVATVSPEPIRVPPPRPIAVPIEAGEQSAEPERYVARRPVWPSFIASAQAATAATAFPTRRQMPIAAPSGRIFIQAGMFAVAENAHRVRARFANLASTEVVRVNVNGAALYRVRLGPLASEAEARHLLGKLAESGIPDARVVGD
jgi:rare lipoprotein A